MVDQIPELITKEYILAHWPKREWIPLLEAQIDQTVSWSISESAAIADGSDLLEYAE